MITPEEARKHYRPDESPSDKEMTHKLAFMYWLAERVWESISDDEAGMNKQEVGAKKHSASDSDNHIRPP